MELSNVPKIRRCKYLGTARDARVGEGRVNADGKGGLGWTIQKSLAAKGNGFWIMKPTSRSHLQKPFE